MQRQKPDLLASFCPVLSKERADVHGNWTLEGHCRSRDLADYGHVMLGSVFANDFKNLKVNLFDAWLGMNMRQGTQQCTFK